MANTQQNLGSFNEAYKVKNVPEAFSNCRRMAFMKNSSI